MRGKTYSSMWDAVVKISASEGPRGFFHGWTANTLKACPSTR